MELLKLDERPAEYQYGDVTFLFRPVATNGDKFEIDTAGELTPDGKVKYSPWDFYKVVIKRFVVGWKGVTQDGKEVPFDFDTFYNRLPASEEDLVMKLGLHIAKTTGLYKDKGELDAEKNV